MTENEPTEIESIPNDLKKFDYSEDVNDKVSELNEKDNHLDTNGTISNGIDPESNFDDDEFGDFEEASFSAAPAAVRPSQSIEEPEDPFPESPRKQTEFGFAKFDGKELKPQNSFDLSVSIIFIDF